MRAFSVLWCLALVALGALTIFVGASADLEIWQRAVLGGAGGALVVNWTIVFNRVFRDKAFV